MASAKTFPIVFFGSEENSVTILQQLSLLSYLKIVAVVTKPPRPSGRQQRITPTAVDQFAQEINLPILAPKKIDQKFCQLVCDRQPVLGILAAYGKIIPQELIDIFPKGIINIHPSLLPQFRGSTPVVAAILSGQKTTGVSLFLIDEKVDHGPLIAQEEMDIDPHDNQLTLTKKLFQLGGQLLEKTLPQYLNNEIIPVKQNHKLATFTKLLSREDGKIELTDLKKALKGDTNIARVIDRKIRAFYPWPGTYTLLAGQRAKIIKAHREDNFLKIDQIQFAGKNPLAWDKNLENIFLK
jgi:methionyl-tRNA formyltransferase